MGVSSCSPPEPPALTTGIYDFPYGLGFVLALAGHIRSRKVTLDLRLGDYFLELFIGDTIGHGVDTLGSSLALQLRLRGEIGREQDVLVSSISLCARRDYGCTLASAGHFPTVLPFADANPKSTLGTPHELGGMQLHVVSHTELLRDLLNRCSLTFRLRNSWKVLGRNSNQQPHVGLHE